VPANLIAPFWDDMVVDPITRGLEVYYQYDGTKLIVQYDIRRIATFDPPWYSFQVQLYPSGDIMFLYNTLGTTTDSATIGIQNSTKDDGLMMVHNADYVHEGLAILITSGPSWLSVGTESGVLPAGECVDIDVIMDASELEEGDYYGTLTLTSNDPADPVKTMDVIFHVGTVDVAACDVDPNTLNLSSNGKWMTGRVELLPGYDPADVVVETVLFNGTVPVDGSHYSLSEDFNDNGIMDMMFKFDRSAIEEILPEGEHVEVVITGEIRDTTYFVARDTIRVIQPRMRTPNGGLSYYVNTPLNVTWDDPENVNVDHADLYYTLDGGVTWEPMATGITGNRYEWTVPLVSTEEARIRVFVFDNQGYVIGFDSSDEYFTVTNDLTAVDEVVPLTYALQNAYPNPFNPKTTIAFDLPHAGMTKLMIYDVRGRLVKTLVSEDMPMGSHEVTWFGTDDRGRQVASGVYYYRIQSGTFTAVKPMTLLK